MKTHHKMIPRFEFFEHTGDVGLEIFARSKEELFALAARGMTALVTDVNTVQPRERMKLSVEADRLDDLLIVWLNRLNFLFETEGWLFSEFRVLVEENFQLNATARGELFDPARHEILREIKAATYHQLTVEKRGTWWYARVIFDL